MQQEQPPAPRAEVAVAVAAVVVAAVAVIGLEPFLLAVEEEVVV